MRLAVITSLLPAVFWLASVRSLAGEYFLEAESFTASAGWKVLEGPIAREASALKMPGGASGDAKGAATTTLGIKDAGRYHIWVRYSSHPTWRGPFHLTALAGDRLLGDGVFDASFEGQGSRDRMTWFE